MPAERERVRHHRRGRPRPGTEADRRRSAVLTTLLAGVLLGLGGYELTGDLQTTRATNAHRASLARDAQFSEARNAIALEEVHVRHFQVEPSQPVKVEFVQAAGTVTSALNAAGRSGGAAAYADAQRLLREQRAYREVADGLIDRMSARPNPITQLDDATYTTLQRDIDTVARSYHASAEREATQLRFAQQRMLAGTAIGFTFGLALVAMIWRLVLGYQRRLVANAAASQRMALHDPLTGLPNRAYFNERLREAVEEAGRDRTRQLALMILDLDGFKAVNDTLGHQAGDQLLIVAGQRVRDTVRDGDLVARLGGDEFAVLLPAVENTTQIRHVADRINDVLRSDFRLASGPAAVSGSIGVVAAVGATNTEELIRHADSAMYRAKSTGGGVAYYDPTTDLESPNNMGLYGELRALIDSGDPWRQLSLHYQPQIRLDDGSVNAVEALVRWNHGSRGVLKPEDFLPLAEARGLEIPLTYHLLDAAVDQAVRWYLGGSPLVVSVNVSPRCLLDDDFVPRVRAAVERATLPSRLLRLEITETSVMADAERAVAALRDVHRLGVLLSVDDYGTGFSSLTQLKRIPADELKIDRAFIKDITTDTGDEVLVRSTIAMAHDLGMSTVAEGVEDLAALALLAELGCDFAQGYAISPPVPAGQVPTACRDAEQAARRLPVRSP